jgi:hypothetical protein
MGKDQLDLEAQGSYQVNFMDKDQLARPFGPGIL